MCVGERERVWAIMSDSNSGPETPPEEDAPLPPTESGDDEPVVTEEELAKIQAKKEKRARTRSQLLLEIVATEKSYIDQLDALNELYIKKLKSNNILPLKKCDSLFGNATCILEFNRIFCNDLTERIENNKGPTVGELFCDFAKYLQMYHGYVKQNVGACHLSNKLVKTNKDFKKFCDENLANPKSKGLSLNSLLITPVQRVPRYRMLLQEIIKNTEPDHPDLGSLEEAIVHIKGAAMEINEAVREMEMRETLNEMSSEMIGLKEPLDKIGRKFVERGELVKVCRKKNKRFVFYLFSDLLIYGAPKGTDVVVSKSIPVDYDFKTKTVDLADDDTRVSPVDGSDLLKWGLEVTNCVKSFLLVFPTEDDRNKWDGLFKGSMALVMGFNSQASPRRSKTTAKAVWESDGSGKQCPFCGIKFTLTNRRHHCRFCGKLCCNACSKNRVPFSDGARARACDLCFAASQEDSLLKVIEGSKKTPDSLFEGYLSKEGGIHTTVNRRYMVLTKDAILYFKTQDDPIHKGKIDLVEAGEEVAVDEGRSNTTAFAFTVKPKDNERTYLLMAGTDKMRMMWMDAIISRKENAANYSDTLSKKDASSIREGAMFKQGGRVQSWNKRHFVLHVNSLDYYRTINDLKPAGSICLSKGVAVKCLQPGDVKKMPENFGFMCTPSGGTRKYMFMCCSEQDREEWVEAVNQRFHLGEEQKKNKAQRQEEAQKQEAMALERLGGLTVGPSDEKEDTTEIEKESVRKQVAPWLDRPNEESASPKTSPKVAPRASSGNAKMKNMWTLLRGKKRDKETKDSEDDKSSISVN